MRVYQEHEALIHRLWDRLERRVAAYPTEIARQGKSFFVHIQARERRYFSREGTPPLLYLPIWLGRGVDRRRLLDVLEATALLYFYVRIQDDNLDEPETRGHRDWLLLGNAFVWDALEGFRRCTSDRRFWRLASRAWTTFTEATAAERTELGRPRATRAYPTPLFDAHARKVAVAEIPLYAVLALKGSWSDAPRVPTLIHRLGQAYGITNDLTGLEADLEARMRTYVIAALQKGLPEENAWDFEVLCARALHTDVCERVLSRAIRLHEEARPLGRAMGMRAFDAFTDERIEELTHYKGDVLLARLAAVVARGRPPFPALQTSRLQGERSDGNSTKEDRKKDRRPRAGGQEDSQKADNHPAHRSQKEQHARTGQQKVARPQATFGQKGPARKARGSGLPRARQPSGD